MQGAIDSKEFEVVLEHSLVKDPKASRQTLKGVQKAEAVS